MDQTGSLGSDTIPSLSVWICLPDPLLYWLSLGVDRSRKSDGPPTIMCRSLTREAVWSVIGDFGVS